MSKTVRFWLGLPVGLVVGALFTALALAADRLEKAADPKQMDPFMHGFTTCLALVCFIAFLWGTGWWMLEPWAEHEAS